MKEKWQAFKEWFSAVLLTMKGVRGTYYTHIAGDVTIPPVFIKPGDNVSTLEYSPALRHLKGDCKKNQHVRYLGPKGYTSPLGKKYTLHTYGIFDDVTDSAFSTEPVNLSRLRDNVKAAIIADCKYNKYADRRSLQALLKLTVEFNIMGRAELLKLLNEHFGKDSIEACWVTSWIKDWRRKEAHEEWEHFSK